MQTETVTIEAESDWHHSQSDATSECDDRLDSLERSAISDAESRGLVYVQGSTSGYDIEYNSSDDTYKCSCKRTLEFDYPDNSSLKVNSEFKLRSEDETLKTLDPNEFNETPEDVTVQLRALVMQVAPPNIRADFLRHPVPQVYSLSSVDIKNLKIISSDLIIDKDVELIGLPTEETIRHYPYQNCTSRDQTLKRDVTVKVERGFKVEFSKAVTTEETISGDLKFKFQHVEAGAEMERKIKVEIKNTQTITELRSETVVESFDFTIAANTITDIKLTIQQIQARRRFEGTILLDGDVTLNYFFSKRGRHQYHKVEKPLSGHLSESQRTLNLNGYYSNIDYQTAPTELTEKPCP